MIQKLKNHRLYLKHRHFILYVMVALVGIAVDVGCFNFCHWVLGFNERWSQFIGANLGLINNFILNALFNFKTTNKIAFRFLSYYGINFIGMLIRDQLMLLFALKLGFNASLVQLVALAFVSLAQFVANKFITFRRMA
jgi:putative flippase GtrA